jgi:hypothetical protein
MPSAESGGGRNGSSIRDDVSGSFDQSAADYADWRRLAQISGSNKVVAANAIVGKSEWMRKSALKAYF